MSDTVNILSEFCAVGFKILWAFLSAGLKWFVRPKEKNIAGQVCLVTGAGGALGRLFAAELARRRAVLVLWDINREGNEETAEMVREIHRETSARGAGAGDTILPQVYTYLCDVGRRESVYATAARVRREVGSVDVLVNSACVLSRRHLLECPDELIEKTLAVNCHAHFWTTKAFLPDMLKANTGHIVTVASSMGLFSTPGMEDYCASKFGAIGFHESLSHELKAAEKHGVRMTLCPFLEDAGICSGCRVRKDMTPLFPLPHPERCVRQAVRAVLTDQPVVCAPRGIHVAAFMKTVLPFEAVVCMYRFLGAVRCSHPYVDHQQETMNNNEAAAQD